MLLIVLLKLYLHGPFDWVSLFSDQVGFGLVFLFVDVIFLEEAEILFYFLKVGMAI